ncbi:MAG TPA: hypothetical protein ENJ65_01645 [Candidatus Tenderia electrophaga]|uniref:HMA domain-containing protein n=1 Tax=Candidatus Tenderia electrophaga TaxID=1748243 RepID=A0A832N3H1_9GAMM|nr:hypothetical protein [Candidatus Tenderia electrophaga]
MFRSLSLAFVIALSIFGLVLPGTAQAEKQQAITLKVENMTCGSCPYTVRLALKQVDGVKQVSAKYEGHGEGWAKVTFDPGKTDVERLIKATTNAGYPSHL